MRSLALAVLSTGCSVALIRSDPKPTTCTSSNAVPALDVLGSIGLIGFAAALSGIEAGAEEPSQNATPLIVGAAIGSVVTALSAGYGFRAVSRCRDAIDLAARQPPTGNATGAPDVATTSSPDGPTIATVATAPRDPCDPFDIYFNIYGSLVYGTHENGTTVQAGLGYMHRWCRPGELGYDLRIGGFLALRKFTMDDVGDINQGMPYPAARVLGGGELEVDVGPSDSRLRVGPRAAISRDDDKVATFMIGARARYSVLSLGIDVSRATTGANPSVNPATTEILLGAGLTLTPP